MENYSVERKAFPSIPTNKLMLKRHSIKRENTSNEASMISTNITPSRNLFKQTWKKKYSKIDKNKEIITEKKVDTAENIPDKDNENKGGQGSSVFKDDKRIFFDRNYIPKPSISNFSVKSVTVYRSINVLKVSEKPLNLCKQNHQNDSIAHNNNDKFLLNRKFLAIKNIILHFIHGIINCFNKFCKKFTCSRSNNIIRINKLDQTSFDDIILPTKESSFLTDDESNINMKSFLDDN